mgnify:FL=1
MIISSLVTLYESLLKSGKIAPTEFEDKKIQRAIILTDDGAIKDIVQLASSDEKEKRPGALLRIPKWFVRTSGICPNFLADTSEYLLGCTAGKDEKAKAKFEASKNFHLKLLSLCSSPLATVICRFFESCDPSHVLEVWGDRIKAFSKGDVMTFETENGEFFVGNEEICRAWSEYYFSNKDGEDKSTCGRCLVTGRKDEKIGIVHDKIKVAGSQASGGTLVGFNSPAFESYGLKKNMNAPVGEYAMLAYTSALNYLLKTSSTHTRLGNDTIVWWTEDGDEETCDAFSAFFRGNDDSKLASIVQNISKGKNVDLNDENRLRKQFCILSLSPNAARVSVRFFYRNSFGYFLNNIASHSKRMEISAPNGMGTGLLSPYGILCETIPKGITEKSKAIPPIFLGALLTSILNNQRYPEAIYDSVIFRTKIEVEGGESSAKYKVSPRKAAFIKAYLLKNVDYHNYKEVLTVALNNDCNDEAYILGRLFAVLETAQYHANNSTNLSERYLSAACSTPALVFPTLLKLASHHVAKTDRGGFDQRDIEDLLSRLEGGKPFPKQFNNEEQGMFLLGYYQQRSYRFEKAKVN